MSVSATGEIVFTVKVDSISNPLELLQFRSKSNVQPESISIETSTEAKLKKRTRHDTKENLARLRTIQNKMIYNSTCEFPQGLNGPAFDPEMLDRTLERSEALRDLKRKHPQVVIFGPNSRTWREDYHEYLAELGLTNKNQQDLVISRMESTEPYSDAEILTIVKAANAAQEEPIPLNSASL